MSERRYIRQEIFAPIGADGQRRIGAGAVVVVGCGALGTNVANNLARSGVGRLRIVDRDFVELDNLQRQVLFDEGHVRRRMPKAVAAVERLGEINSAIRLEAEVADASPANVESLIAGFDVVVDGTDNVEARLLLNDACLKARVPYIFGGCVGSTGMTMAFVPGHTPCYRCLVGALPEPGATPTAATAGILNATTAVVGAVEATLALRLLTGTYAPTDELLCVDVWEREFTAMAVPRVADCPACGQGRYEFLTAARRPTATAVPGTNSVRLPSAGPVAIRELAEAWRPLGVVVANDWLATLAVGGHELIVFADGRAVVKGTGDPEAAQELFRRYVPRGDPA